MTGWKLIGFIGCASVAASSLLLSSVHPWGDPRAVASGAQLLEGSAAPEHVRNVIQQKCGDCHSNETQWPIYSRAAPVSWLVEHDVLAGRSAMNLSHWAATKPEDRIAALARIAAEVRTGEMPPRPYAMMHPANRFTAIDKQQIIAWTRDERKHIRAENPSPKENP
jgi:cytochrome c